MDVTKSIFEGLDWFVLGLYFAILVGGCCLGSFTEKQKY